VNGPVGAGTARMLAGRAARIAAGERPIGWKVGFGAPAALERFGLEGPLVGFLTDRGIVESGDSVSVGNWIRPVAEAEVALWFGGDVAPDADASAIRRAISGVGAAIELADIDHDPADPERIVADNIFHRHVVFGMPDGDRRGGELAGLVARVDVGGDEVAFVTELEALTGGLVEVVGHTARTLASFGVGITKGDVLIGGSVMPPVPVQPGVTVRYALEPLASISVTLV